MSGHCSCIITTVRPPLQLLRGRGGSQSLTRSVPLLTPMSSCLTCWLSPIALATLCFFAAPNFYSGPRPSHSFHLETLPQTCTRVGLCSHPQRNVLVISWERLQKLLHWKWHPLHGIAFSVNCSATKRKKTIDNTWQFGWILREF